MIAVKPLEPEFAAADRYEGEWVVPIALGRAHLVAERTLTTVRTACGRTFVGPLPAARLWDGCVRCVAVAVPR